ncbi:IS3 family transposase [Gilliamella sp. App4-10]|uniref:IS3 family transposase n=1 Tax=Gilliamella sp. App4-10 TaxID=3120231 RepID=UPI00159EC14D|nr:IS3 family transposase [Gilliamella apicola]
MPGQRQDIVLSEIVAKIFDDNYQSYGTRRMKAALSKQGIALSRRRTGRIMAKNGWV